MEILACSSSLPCPHSWNAASEEGVVAVPVRDAAAVAAGGRDTGSRNCRVHKWEPMLRASYVSSKRSEGWR